MGRMSVNTQVISTSVYLFIDPQKKITHLHISEYKTIWTFNARTENGARLEALNCGYLFTLFTVTFTFH